MLTPWLTALFLLAAPAATPPTPSLNSGPVVTSSGTSVGRELARARELLSRAHNQLEPPQWELLDGKLKEAEAAWERINAAARASGRAVEVARGAEGVVEAGRTTKLIEVAPRLALTAADAALALGALVVLWPSTAHAPGPPRTPQTELEAKLSEVSKAAQQVSEEIERKIQSAPAKQLAKDAPKEASKVKTPGWKKECMRVYNECVDHGRWSGTWTCHDCFRYCEGQQEWPFAKCFPP